jgi:hypothetical protein
VTSVLSGGALLDLWDAGEGASGPAQALTVLAACGLGAPAEAAPRPTGWRDRALLAACRSLHGPALAGLIDCAACGSAIEVSLDIDALIAVMTPAGGEDAAVQAAPFRFSAGALCCTCRVPDTLDHLAVLAQGAPAPARHELLVRCVSALSRAGVPIAVVDLTETETAAIGAAIEARDPGAVVSVDVFCPVCARPETCFLDPPSFVWRRIAADAQQLLHEVHALAAAYGWREADVVALPARRRRRYLRLATP